MMDLFIEIECSVQESFSIQLCRNSVVTNETKILVALMSKSGALRFWGVLPFFNSYRLEFRNRTNSEQIPESKPRH